MNIRLVRFLASGGAAATIEYGTFSALHICLGNNWLIVNQSVSFATGFAASFLLNRSWVFRSSGVVRSELLKYGFLAAINLVTGNLAITLLSGPLSVNQYVAKLLVMAMIASWNYLLFAKLVFKPSAGEV